MNERLNEQPGDADTRTNDAAFGAAFKTVFTVSIFRWTRSDWRGAAALVAVIAVSGVATGLFGSTGAHSAAAASAGIPQQDQLSPQQTASPSPGPSPTWEAREFYGLFGAAFEISAFAEGEICPDHGGGWWLHGNGDFNARYDELTAHRSPYGGPYGRTTPYVVEVRFRGRLSPPGQSGHLGSYDRLVQVDELIEMEDTDQCGMVLPDLALASYQVHWSRETATGCVPADAEPIGLEICIVNQGRTTSGPAWVTLTGDGETVTRRICALEPGETRCLPPIALLQGPVEIDTENEVEERFEDNNWTYIDGTVDPPPRCTPVSPGEPTMTPLPTRTLQPCVTPETLPTRDGSRTATPSATVTDGTSPGTPSPTTTADGKPSPSGETTAYLPWSHARR